MKVALDTNVLAYAEGINGAEQRAVALDFVRRLSQETTVIRFRFWVNSSTSWSVRPGGLGAMRAKLC